MHSEDIDRLISEMTLEEKASLCSGRDFWNLKGVERLGVPSITVTDGPHGVRRQQGAADHVGLQQAVPATCFPTASALASSWDVELLSAVGAAIAEEAHEQQVAVVLGPGANIKRSPLCGRNFEYFSEDPFLSGHLAAAFIRAVEARGIGTSLKHFAVNNQEFRRMTVNAVVDERALREIYLAGFEIAVRDGRPSTVMSAYNRVNGRYCSDHDELLTTILRDEWGFEGFVVTDWGGLNERVPALRAGCDLEMPASGGENDALIVQAVRTGVIGEEVVDRAVRRILPVVFRTSEALAEPFSYDRDAHHQLARRAAAESIVLLKNDGILPLVADGAARGAPEEADAAAKEGAPRATIGVIGTFARDPRYQGSGSSLVNPHRVDNAWDALVARVGEGRLRYAEGYDANVEAPDETRIAAAVEVARTVDIVLLFAGLPDISESEGFDRRHLAMPPSHNDLIAAVAAVNPRTVVVLSNGAPVTMPWLPAVPALLETYLGGQAWGPAVVDVLFGDANPSGKLAESFPRAIGQCSATPNFPGGTATVAYAESVYVGYRYYDTAGVDVLFPFGFGLSYTTFAYQDLSVVAAGDGFDVAVTVANTGIRAGAEIIQVYVRDPESSAFRPSKELKGFAKVRLGVGEEQRVRVHLDRRAFAVWDAGAHRWVVEAGAFEILVGASSSDIRLTTTVMIETGDPLSSSMRSLRERVPGYFAPDPVRFADRSPQGDFAAILGAEVPAADRPKGRPFDRTSTLEDLQATLVGRMQFRVAMARIEEFVGDADPKQRAMMEAVVREMPLRSLGLMGNEIPMGVIDGMILLANGRLLRGIRAIRRAWRASRRSARRAGRR